jgi:hypothetical protein
MHVSHSRLPRSVTALSLIEGAVTRLAAPNCNPARPLPFFLAGKCPLHARAIVILSGAAHGWHGKSLPFFLLHQFTNRRIRMFITIPSARNMNRTEDPP